MLFNLDRNLKQSILAEYKKEALLHREKRELEKKQKLKEEQDYLDQLNKEDEQTLQKLEIQFIILIIMSIKMQY